jgi:hypothetical protein
LVLFFKKEHLRSREANISGRSKMANPPLKLWRWLPVSALAVLTACTANPAADVTPDMLRALTSQAPDTPPPAMPAPPNLAAPPAAHPAIATAAPRPGSAQQPQTQTAPAPPGTEQLIVTAPASIGGFWEIMVPVSVSISIPAGTRYGAVSRSLCRFVQHTETISGGCLSNELTALSGTYRNGAVRMELGAAIFSGTVSSANHMQGNLRLGVFGLGLTAPIPIAGWRLNGQHGLPAPQGTADAMRALLAAPDTGTSNLGALSSLSYLGTTSFPHHDAPTDALDVFVADFANGTRLCGLARSGARKVMCA